MMLPGPQEAEAVMVAFARIGAMVMLVPGLGERAIPTRQRLVLALALTLMAMPSDAGAAAGMPAILRMLSELMIGLAIGACARLLLAAMEMAGAFTAQSIGLSFAQVVDPSQGQQGEAMSTFFRMLGVATIFAADLHHVAIAGIVSSYHHVPAGSVFASADLLALALRLVTEVFRTALAIAAPFIAFGLVFNAGLALAGRLSPNMQLFFIAVPVSIAVGLAALALALPFAVARFRTLASDVLTLLLPAG